MNKRKIFVATTVMAIIVTLFSGCTFNITGGVEGVGEMVSRSFDVEDFSSIDITGAFEVTWRQDDSRSVAVEAQENLLELLQVEVTTFGTLVISFSENITVRNRENTPRIYINSPHLEIANFGGASDTVNWDKIIADTFSLSASGASNINLDLEVETLNISTDGASDINLGGTAGSAVISVSGAANISAARLQIRDAAVVVSGAADVNIAVSDNVDVTVTGAGTVRYSGDPVVTQDISGAGSLVRVD